MQSKSNIRLIIAKDDDYKPISTDEKERIQGIIMAELVDIAERYDGSVRLWIELRMKGNC